MSRRRSRRKPRRLLLTATGAVIAVVIVALLATHGDWHRIGSRIRSEFGTPETHALSLSATSIDPANDGKRIRVSGELSIGKPPRDPRLDVSATAAVLFRHVEMYQWRERCNGGNCIYETVWSQQPIDSSKFDRPDGHGNPPFPFTDAQFAASDIRLGAFHVDPAVVAATGKVTGLPVNTSTLPPNLAATFRDIGGALYAGDNPAQPAIGDLRVSFSEVAVGKATLTGVQHGSRLSAN